MDKFEIEASIKEKYDDEYTIKMFTNFVWEFQECFLDIMSTEAVIDRIKKNVFGNIRIVDEFDNKRLDGRYAEDGHIYLKKSAIESEKYVKYLLFHEMLHAVTAIKDENGNDIMLGFSYLKNSRGMGLNEAMTEYLTLIRNERFEENKEDLISGYRTVVEQLRRLILIIGNKELMQAYFYNPDSLKELFRSKKMDYDEVEIAYRNLAGNDEDVRLTGYGKRLNNNGNYRIHRFSEKIFDNYSKAIGEVNSIEDLKRKYKIFQTYVDGEYDCIITMFLTYYKNLGNDVTQLLRKGIPFNDIKNTLQEFNIDMNNLAGWYNFSKCLVSDKNKSAINIYEYYQKNPNFYMRIFGQNFGTIFDHFNEEDVIPNDNTLYDAWRYPFIGLLLKEHPELDFTDVSYDFVEERNSKINVFIFSSSNGKKYAYNMNGKKVEQVIDKDGNESFLVEENDQFSCKIIYDKNGEMTYSYNAKNDFDLEEFMKNVNFQIQHAYSEREIIQSWIDNGLDTDGSLVKRMESIKERMKRRSEVDFFDV